MADKNPFSIEPCDYREWVAGWHLRITLERDFVDLESFRSAPGVGRVIAVTDRMDSPHLQVFLFITDPLYEKQEDALVEVFKWLEGRVVKLDDSVWGSGSTK